MTWKCICCEKPIEILEDNKDDDKNDLLPNLVGGTIEIHFGYGSKFDQLEDMVSRHDVRIQSAICDSCFYKKEHLTRKIEVVKNKNIK